MSGSEHPHPRERRSHGEEYPGRGDADSLEEQYGASDEDAEPDEDEQRDEEDDPG